MQSTLGIVRKRNVYKTVSLRSKFIYFIPAVCFNGSELIYFISAGVQCLVAAVNSYGSYSSILSHLKIMLEGGRGREGRMDVVFPMDIRFRPSLPFSFPC